MSKKSRNFELAVDRFFAEAAEAAETLEDIYTLIRYVNADEKSLDGDLEAIVNKLKVIISRDPEHVDPEELIDALIMLAADDEVYIELNKIVPLGHYMDII